jgi:hypothetical protein
MARFKLKHVNTFICSDGRVRHYFRRGGAKAIPLPGLPGSEEFMTAYGAALAALPGNNAAEIGAGRTSPGSVSALVVAYYRSSAWDALERKRGRRAGGSLNASARSMATSASLSCGKSTF